jgi:hypothetical protein
MPTTSQGTKNMNQNRTSPSTKTTGGTQRNTGNGSSSRSRGKSRYAQKARGKSQRPVAAKPRGPVNTYTSVCCSLPATKPAAASIIAGSKDRTGLGHFRCSGCKKSAKVTVSKFKAPEASVVVEVPVVSQN